MKEHHGCPNQRRVRAQHVVQNAMHRERERERERESERKRERERERERCRNKATMIPGITSKTNHSSTKT